MYKLFACVIAVSTAGFVAMPAVAIDAKISGTVQVIDGDTIDVNGSRIRLFGIDAPEGGQTCLDARGVSHRCGDWVSTEVRKAYQGQQAQCQRMDTDRYGRIVARCTVWGADVGRALVAQGLAFAYAKYSQDYISDEAAAMQAKRGIHAYLTVRPAVYRAEQKARKSKPTRKAEETERTGCTIKGNISAKGVRIFHVAGQRDYQKTTIRTDRGERWFCSQADARAAGWRAARR